MSNTVCMLHTDRPATALCTECGRPLCQECTRTVADKPVCQNCLAAIRSRVAVQLNAEAASAPPLQPPPPPVPNAPYAPPRAYPPVGQPPVAQPYQAPRVDLAGNAYPPSGAPYPAPQPYGASPNAAYPPPPPQSPGGAPQAPYGAQPGYGAPAQPPYGQQQGQGAQPVPGQPAYNPYGTAPQPGYPSAHPQSSYGAPQQPYAGQTPYGGQYPSQPLSAPLPAINPGNYILGIIFGLGAAILGAVLYIWVIYATGVSIGYMALGVGFIIGWAVKLGTRMPSQAAGIIAGVLTVLAILPVRFLLFHSTANIFFTVLFLFIGCRWAYRIAAGGS